MAWRRVISPKTPMQKSAWLTNNKSERFMCRTRRTIREQVYRSLKRRVTTRARIDTAHLVSEEDRRETVAIATAPNTAATKTSEMTSNGSTSVLTISCPSVGKETGGAPVVG